MSDDRRRLVIYEQTDGSFRIPPDVARHMGPGTDPIKLTEGSSLSIPLATKQQQNDDVAYLRYENQLYKKRYLQCMKQFGELLELNQLISTKLDLAIHSSDEGLEIEATPLRAPTGLVLRGQPFMAMDPLQAAINETASTSGRGSKGPKLENMKIFPPKKRHRQ